MQFADGRKKVVHPKEIERVPNQPSGGQSANQPPANQPPANEPPANQPRTFKVGDEAAVAVGEGGTIRGTVTQADVTGNRYVIMPDDGSAPMEVSGESLLPVDTEQPAEQVEEQPTEQPTEQPEKQPVEQPIEQTAEQTPEQSTEQTPEQPVSASDKILKDANGEPMYETATPEAAWDAITEQAGGDETITVNVVKSTIADIKDELKKLKAKVGKSKGTVTQKIQAERELADRIKATEQRIASWETVLEVPGQRAKAKREYKERAERETQVEAEREAKEKAETKTAAEQEAKEKAEQEAKTKTEQETEVGQESKPEDVLPVSDKPVEEMNREELDAYNATVYAAWRQAQDEFNGMASEIEGYEKTVRAEVESTHEAQDKELRRQLDALLEKGEARTAGEEKEIKRLQKLLNSRQERVDRDVDEEMSKRYGDRIKQFDAVKERLVKLWDERLKIADRADRLKDDITTQGDGSHVLTRAQDVVTGERLQDEVALSKSSPVRFAIGRKRIADLTKKELDKAYFEALDGNDMDYARQLVDEAARRAGYTDMESDYQGRGTWTAPGNPGYTDEERRAALEADAPDINVEDIAKGFNLVDESVFYNPRVWGGKQDAHEAIIAIRQAVSALNNGRKPTITVYRAVPTAANDDELFSEKVRENYVRNGDWVTPSKSYAIEHGEHRFGKGRYRIIEQEVEPRHLWLDGNDIREWGFDDGNEYRYQNTRNNRKLNDIVTYDYDGNIIPLSKRFNKREYDTRFSIGEPYDVNENPVGRAEPGLSDKSVAVVSVPRHDFKGTGKEALQAAGSWATDNLVGEYSNEETGGKGVMYVSGNAISKFLSRAAVHKSDSLGAHLAVLKRFKDVLRESADCESHPDFKKSKDGERRPENGIASKNIIHRLYGAVVIDGKTYRVKTTVKEQVATRKRNAPYTYEVTEIELLDGPMAGIVNDGSQLLSDAPSNSIPLAKLLKNARMSYAEAGKEANFLLDESRKRDEKDKARTTVAETVKTVAAELQDKFGVEVEVVDSLDGVKNEQARKAITAGQDIKGWYDLETGKVCIYAPNAESEQDVMATYAHEVVAHKGMRGLLGEERYNELCERLGEALTPEQLELVEEYAGKDADVLGDEYIARIAEMLIDEKGEIKEPMTWGKVKGAVREFFRHVFGLELTDADIRYLLWRSGERLRRNKADVLTRAQDVVTGQKLNDDAARYRTTRELDRQHPGWRDQTTPTGRHSTQRANTVNTYRKIGEWIKREMGDGATVLDASSGLGLGTQELRSQGLAVDDVEPYPDSSREAPTFAGYDEIDKQYDVVVSNAVLNVVPDDTRSELLHQMADMVKPGGRIIINVRDAGEIERQKQKIELDSPSEVLVTDRLGNVRSYQKGFTPDELRQWVADDLGEEWTIEKADKDNSGLTGATAVVAVRKEGMNPLMAESEQDEALSRVNDAFNTQLRSFAPETADKVTFKLGRPSDILIAAGVVDKEMKLYGSKLLKKIREHGFALSEIKDLPLSIASPIAVFDNHRSGSNRAILTELRTADGNILVTIEVGKGGDVDFNIVSSVFGKRGNSVVNWINKGYATYIDKEKALNYLHLSAPIAEATESQELAHAAKVIQKFENPQTERENLPKDAHFNSSKQGDLFQRAQDVLTGERLQDESARMRQEEADYQREIREITERAKADGTFMKAPNGKPSNLDERQWAHVRSTRFKQWFGDWELLQLYSQALRAWGDKESKGKTIVGLSGRAKQRLTELFGHDFTQLVITDDAIRHIKKRHGNATSEQARGQVALTAEDIVTIPYIIGNFDMMELIPTHDDSLGNKAVEVRKRINGVSIVGTIARGKDKLFVVTSWKMEKSDALDVSSTPGPNVRNDSDIAKVKKEIEIIKEKAKNCSRVVDENGEPQVMYHGTRARFNIFDGEKIGSNLDFGTVGRGFYFTDSLENAENIARNARGEGAPVVMSCFLNIRKPTEASTMQLDGSRRAAERFTRRAQSKGFDGVTAESGYGISHLKWQVAFSPNQIKSATDNVGTYDTSNDDIRFAIGKKRKDDMRKGLLNKLTNASEEQVGQTITEIEKLGEQSKAGGDAKVEKAALHWVQKGTIILPEDGYKVIEAVKMATDKGIDVTKYDSPMRLINENTSWKKRKDMADPDKVATLTGKRALGNTGITIYDVEDSEQGQRDMRMLWNGTWGEERSCPWCLLHDDGHGGVSAQAKHYWSEVYTGYAKQVAFKDGRPIAFFAEEEGKEPHWWDLNDHPHKGILVEGKIPNDELGRDARMLYNMDGSIKGYAFISRGNKENGIYETWWSLDAKRSEGFYENGRPRAYKEWDEEGTLREYDDGLRQYRWDKEGSLLSAYIPERGSAEWHKNGVPASVSVGWSKIRGQIFPIATSRCEWTSEGRLMSSTCDDIGLILGDNKKQIKREDGLKVSLDDNNRIVSVIKEGSSGYRELIPERYYRDADGHRYYHDENGWRNSYSRDYCSEERQSEIERECSEFVGEAETALPELAAIEERLRVDARMKEVQWADREEVEKEARRSLKSYHIGNSDSMHSTSRATSPVDTGDQSADETSGAKVDKKIKNGKDFLKSIAAFSVEVQRGEVAGKDFARAFMQYLGYNDHGQSSEYIHFSADNERITLRMPDSSVQEFVEHVGKNYNRIQEGVVRQSKDGNNHLTYLVQLTDEHNNTLFVELSSDGEYWSVNSAGVFNHKYGNNKKNIWSASSVQNVDPAADSGGLRTNDKTGSAFVPKGTPSNNSSSAKVIQGFENPNTNRQNSDGNALFRDDPLATILGDGYVKASEAKAQVDDMTTAATEAAGKLGLDNVVVLPDGRQFTGRKARAKGWYDFKTGKIYIIAGNHTGKAALQRRDARTAEGHVPRVRAT